MFYSNFEEDLEAVIEIFGNDLNIVDRGYSKDLLIDVPFNSSVETKFININLCLTIKNNSRKPNITVKHFWGLNECDVTNLINYLDSCNIDESDNNILYTIIENSNAYLRDRNLPRIPCYICLQQFNSESEIFVTEKHHFFHLDCIETFVYTQYKVHEVELIEAKRNNKYIKESELPVLDLRCPVCRDELIKYSECPSDQSYKKWQYESSLTDDNDISLVLSEKLRGKMCDMRQRKIKQDERILERQKFEEHCNVQNKDQSDQLQQTEPTEVSRENGARPDADTSRGNYRGCYRIRRGRGYSRNYRRNFRQRNRM